ncbi:HAMP domain-containing sensor histidine kinase [Dactylosporangium fulvum]|uniref:histidine kinase n=1 Tax=Dactylosporangium fulvum TaxID=53359 RepID=A0ABY5W2Y6_9ACTN|nr:HAMP domain-containing sensor histidine kinase [Dactylosporangium fulvum]UWP84310.1 HAMP domain-containing histidine kinase [Dactylosporangium fulvum]
MTIYDARRAAFFRPTLRLRLTLLNGILLVGAGLVLVVLAYILVDSALKPADQLQPGTRVVLEDGTEVDARQWQTELVDAAEWELLTRGSLALLLIGAVGVAGAYVVAGRALRPLQKVTTTAQRLSGETLDARINYDGADDEVSELAKTFDAMLDRIAEAFETQKRFVANASHELRTPLAVMRTEVDVTLDDPEADVEEYRRMATVVRDASMRANALVESLLLLARTEAQAGRRLGRKVGADLATGVAVAMSATGKEIKRLNLDVRTDLAPANVVGDPGLLDRLAGNLIENAVRYNHLGGRIWVRTGTDETLAWLVVGNTGFEVDPADVPVLFEPFRRGGRERTGARGSGLGLSIVRAVCDAHGGGVSAVALEGGGLEVTVSLPAAAITPLLSGTAAVPIVAERPAA